MALKHYIAKETNLNEEMSLKKFEFPLPNANRIKEYLLYQLVQDNANMNENRIDVFSGKNSKTHVVIFDERNQCNFSLSLPKSPKMFVEEELDEIVSSFNMTQQVNEDRATQLSSISKK